MLFYLADSLLVDKKSSEYFEIATAISNLAIAAFESKHSISGDIGILEFMSKNIDIDIRARMVLNNVVQQYATQPIPQFITFYLEVVKECEENSFRKDGNRIIAQYPLENVTMNSGNKIFLLTNSEEFKMLDITNWSRGEVETYAKLLGLNVIFDGYGYVKSFNIEVDSVINKDSILEVTLESKYKE